MKMRFAPGQLLAQAIWAVQGGYAKDLIAGRTSIDRASKLFISHRFLVSSIVIHVGHRDGEAGLRFTRAGQAVRRVLTAAGV